MPHAEPVELRHLQAQDLKPLLDEEIAAWKESLDWDFQASAALIQRFLDMQGLSGFALMLDGRPIGYSYFVTEERKGLIGDLYVLKEFVTVENEGLLLSSVLDNMVKTPLVRRIETQLMMLRSAATILLPYLRYLKVFTRDFMELPLAGIDALRPGAAARTVTIDNWTERKQDEAATLIAAAYRGHLDSEINDQYRSPAGARRFLINIVQYPGCGSFFQPAAFVAIDPRNGKLCGICLSSLVSEDVGHITQVAVTKSVRGKGVGYELLRRALQALAQHGCRKATLTVTAANQEAIAVYDKMGFKKTRSFAAYVWEGF
ncbi:MAG: GNAT family N-acetyltransferase [Bryobacteraceae bacterium]